MAEVQALRGRVEAAYADRRRLELSQLTRNWHAAASLLKVYLRELVPPLLSFDLYPYFLACGGSEGTAMAKLAQVELEQRRDRVPVPREAAELEAAPVGVRGLDAPAQRLQLGGLGVLAKQARRRECRAQEGVAAGQHLRRARAQAESESERRRRTLEEEAKKEGRART